MSAYFARLAQRTGLGTSRETAPPPSSRADIVRQDVYVEAASTNVPAVTAPMARLATNPNVAEIAKPVAVGTPHTAQSSARPAIGAEETMPTATAAPSPASASVLSTPPQPERPVLSARSATVASPRPCDDEPVCREMPAIVSEAAESSIAARTERALEPNPVQPQRARTGVVPERVVSRPPNAPPHQTGVDDAPRASRPATTSPTDVNLNITPESPPPDRVAPWARSAASSARPGAETGGRDGIASSGSPTAESGVEVRIGAVRLEIHPPPAAAPPLPLAPSAPARESPRFAPRRHYLRG